MRLLHTATDDGGRKYYADGRRVTRERWHELHAAANRRGSLSCSQTLRKNDRWYFYAEA